MESSIIKMYSTYEKNEASYCRNCKNKNILNACSLCGLSNEERKKYLDADEKNYASSYVKSYTKYI